MAFPPVLPPDSHPDKNIFFAHVSHNMPLSAEHKEHVKTCPNCQAKLKSLRTDQAWHGR